MLEVRTLAVEEVANALKVNPQTIRVGLRRGSLPFGTAIQSQNGGRWKYLIVERKFLEWAGIQKEGENK